VANKHSGGGAGHRNNASGCYNQIGDLITATVKMKSAIASVVHVLQPST